MYLKLVSVAPNWWRVLDTSVIQSSSERAAFEEAIVESSGVKFISSGSLSALRAKLGRYSYQQSVLQVEDSDYSSQVMLTRTEFSSYLLSEVRAAFPDLQVFIDTGFMNNDYNLVVFSMTDGEWTGVVGSSQMPSVKVYGSYNLKKFEGEIFSSSELKKASMKEARDSFISSVEKKAESYNV